MNIQDMVNSGMLTRQEAEALSSSRAMAEYNNSSHKGTSEFAGQENSVLNLKSALSNLITRVATAQEGEFLPEHIELARNYQAQLQNTPGGLEGASLSRSDINSLLTEANVAYSHNPTALESEYSLLAETAQPIQEGITDSEVAEQAALDEAASRNSEKVESPTLTRLNPSTGDLMVLIDDVWTTDDGSVSFSEAHLAAIKQEANQDYNEQMDNSVSESDYMASLETR